jgi:hypothetical protein
MMILSKFWTKVLHFLFHWCHTLDKWKFVEKTLLWMGFNSNPIPGWVLLRVPTPAGYINPPPRVKEQAASPGERRGSLPAAVCCHGCLPCSALDRLQQGMMHSCSARKTLESGLCSLCLRTRNFRSWCSESACASWSPRSRAVGNTPCISAGRPRAMSNCSLQFSAHGRLLFPLMHFSLCRHWGWWLFSYSHMQFQWSHGGNVKLSEWVSFEW